MKTINAIAQVLKVSENQIKSYQEWAHVYFVRFNVGRPTFISKRKVAASFPLVIELQVGKRQAKAWVARLVGLDPKYAFTREFLTGDVIEWGRKGAAKMEFALHKPGLYQDSDGDYYEVAYILDKGLDITRHISRDEAKYRFERQAALA